MNQIIALAQKLLASRLFARQQDISTKAEIIKWWELRRIPFNVVLGITGFCACAMLFLIAGIASHFGEVPDLPGNSSSELFAILGYAILANVCFTGGWITEIIVRKLWGEKAGAFGSISFSLGLFFSILLTLSPVAFLLVFLAIHPFVHAGQL